jgi:hypothetical protein
LAEPADADAVRLADFGVTRSAAGIDSISLWSAPGLSEAIGGEEDVGLARKRALFTATFVCTLATVWKDDFRAGIGVENIAAIALPVPTAKATTATANLAGVRIGDGRMSRGGK